MNTGSSLGNKTTTNAARGSATGRWARPPATADRRPRRAARGNTSSSNSKNDAVSTSSPSCGTPVAASPLHVAPMSPPATPLSAPPSRRRSSVAPRGGGPEAATPVKSSSSLFEPLPFDDLRRDVLGMPAHTQSPKRARKTTAGTVNVDCSEGAVATSVWAREDRDLELARRLRRYSRAIKTPRLPTDLTFYEGRSRHLNADDGGCSEEQDERPAEAAPHQDVLDRVAALWIPSDPAAYAPNVFGDMAAAAFPSPTCTPVEELQDIAETFQDIRNRAAAAAEAKARAKQQEEVEVQTQANREEDLRLLQGRATRRLMSLPEQYEHTSSASSPTAHVASPRSAAPARMRVSTASKAAKDGAKKKSSGGRGRLDPRKDATSDENRGEFGGGDFREQYLAIKRKYIRGGGNEYELNA